MKFCLQRLQLNLRLVQGVVELAALTVGVFADLFDLDLLAAHLKHLADAQAGGCRDAKQ